MIPWQEFLPPSTIAYVGTSLPNGLVSNTWEGDEGMKNE